MEEEEGSKGGGRTRARGGRKDGGKRGKDKEQEA